ncbi:terminase small subunit [Pseudoduganella sp. UC29_106]|uniref:terminase small subunit n=1 Tax=Pseudoduganella sp. UC29_106 TaxID=3374553 RepID=UPI003757663B
MALTGRKLKFAAAKLGGFSNKDAAIKAGYSAATASQAGSRLVKDKDVVAYLKQNKKDAKKVSEPPPASEPPEYVSQPFDLSKVLMFSDALDFLVACMNDPELDKRYRIDCAKKIVDFQHAKPGESGKKDQKQKDAEKVAGRFASAAPPRLAAAGGKKV